MRIINSLDELVVVTSTWLSSFETPFRHESSKRTLKDGTNRTKLIDNIPRNEVTQRLILLVLIMIKNWLVFLVCKITIHTIFSRQSSLCNFVAPISMFANMLFNALIWKIYLVDSILLLTLDNLNNTILFSVCGSFLELKIVIEFTTCLKHKLPI
jgi:hypothetical protein